MLPGVNGFHWTFAHILFLSLFGLVIASLGITVLIAVRRTMRDVSKGQGGTIAWRADFAELPVVDRVCRHQLSGRVDSRVCGNVFDCAHCPRHLELAKNKAADPSETFGLQYPADRLYHRGHTWVHAEGDGTYTVGVDDLVTRVVGKVDSVVMPEVGSEVHQSAAAWTVAKNGHIIRVRAPLTGTVVESGNAERGWFLRIKPPATPNLTALLTADEVPGWLAYEIARLQSLAGGPRCVNQGTFVEGLMDRAPNANWESALGALFLHP